VKSLGETELLEVAIELVIVGLDLGELGGNDALEHVLELVVHGANLRRHQVSEFAVHLGHSVHFFGHGNHVHEVLSVGLGEVSRFGLGVVVYFLVFFMSLVTQSNSLSKFLVKVGLVGAADNRHETFSFLELGHSNSQVGDSFSHTLSLGISSGVLGLSKLPVGLSSEVTGVVAEHIGESAAIVLSQLDVALVGLEGLVEVDSDLSSHVGEHGGLHASVGSFLEEQVLGLR